MSVVAVKNYKDKIVIGADTQGTRGVSYDKLAKLFKEDEYNLFWGTSGSGAELSAYQVFLKTHKPAENNQKGIHEHFVEFMKFKQEYTGNLEINNSYLIIYETKAYYIGGNLYVEQIEENKEEAIGSGYRESKAALMLGHTMKEAIQIACDSNIYCNEPITIHEVGK